MSKHLGVIVSLSLAAAVASITYLTVRTRGELPEMPRISLSDRNEQTALDRLRERVAGFTPSDEEAAVVQQLEQLHVSETAEKKDASSARSVRHQVAQMRHSASMLADKDENRFTLLGDLLALRFQRSVEEVLSMRRRQPPPAERELNFQLMKVRLNGGAFYDRAVERGVIARDGVLKVSRITLEVLFRYRWRHLGGRDLTAGFSDTEKMALHDFTARFTLSSSPERRLEAVNDLKKLDENYDATIARALILYEAGKPDASLRTLEEALKNGRDDVVVTRFIRALGQ